MYCGYGNQTARTVSIIHKTGSTKQNTPITNSILQSYKREIEVTIYAKNAIKIQFTSMKRVSYV